MRLSLIILISILFILAIPSFALSEGIEWQSYDEGTAIAKEQRKKIFLYFYADSGTDPKTDQCPYCSLLYRTTFKNSLVINYLNDNFVSIPIDTYGSIKEKKLAYSYGIRGVPSMRFLKKDNTKIHSLEGYSDAKNLMNVLKSINLQDYYESGIAYKNQGNWAQVIQDFTRAIEIKPDLYQAYFNRGIAYQKQGKVAHSIQDYTRAIEIKPDMYQAYYNRGDAYQNQGNWARAIQDYTMVIEIKPELYQAYNAIGWLYATCKDINYRNSVKAIKFALKSVSLKESSLNLATLSAAYVEDRQLQKALKTYLKVIQNDSRFLKKYQKSLKEKGYYSGQINGVDNQEFQAALKACVMGGKYL